MREISLPAMLIFVNGQPQFSPKAGTSGAATAPLKRKRRPGSLPTASYLFLQDHFVTFRQHCLRAPAESMIFEIFYVFIWH